jgi:hypothetical protein
VTCNRRRVAGFDGQILAAAALRWWSESFYRGMPLGMP